MITCCNLVCGCIATVQAVGGDAPAALLFIILGAVFDFFDGMTARLLGVSSPIGKELDSLADVVTFGVAPSAIVFSFLGTQLAAYAHPVPLLAYGAFVMAAFSGLRLAKFNLDERQQMGFIGLPTPANALFWGALVVGAGQMLGASACGLWAVGVLLPASCYLLVAELPLFALKFKHWGWAGNEVKYVFLLTSALLIAGSFLLGWGVLGIAATIAWYVLLSAATRQRN